MRFSLSLLFLLTINSGFSQKTNLKVGVQSGIYAAKGYENILPGKNISFDMSYIFNNGFILSANSNYGNSTYFREITEPSFITITYENGRNSELKAIHVGLMIGYKIDLIRNLNFSVHTGISSYTENTRQPYAPNPTTYSYQQFSFTDLAFPIRVALNVPIKHFELSMVGGCYIEPDYPITGLHVGPQISYRF